MSGTVPSALTVITPVWALSGALRRAVGYVTGDRYSLTCTPPAIGGIAPPLPPLVICGGAAATATDGYGAHTAAAAASPCSEPASPSLTTVSRTSSITSGSTAVYEPSSPSIGDAGPPCGKVAVPLGRAALLAVFKQRSFSAPAPVRPEETLAAASAPKADACASPCGGAMVCAMSEPIVAPGLARPQGQEQEASITKKQDAIVSWSAAFGGSARHQFGDIPAPAVAKAQQPQQGDLQPQQQQLAATPMVGSIISPGAASAAGRPDSDLDGAAAWPAAAAEAEVPPTHYECTDGVAWRYRFTHKWRRARHVHPIDRFDDSPDPLAFLAAHGAATTVNLATNGPPAAHAAPGAAADVMMPDAARRVCRGGGGSRGSCLGDAADSDASSLAGSIPTGGCGMALPRVFSGGEMHRQLVAEAQRAHAALEQLSAAQQRQGQQHRQHQAPVACAEPAASAATQASAIGSKWVGPLLPAVALDFGSVSHDQFVLARATGSQTAAAGGAASSQAHTKLLLRSRGGGASADQIMSDLESEAAAAAAAARLPQKADMSLVGSGTLFGAGPSRIKVVPGKPAQKDGMSPAAVALLATALLRQAAPADWVVLQ